MQHLDPRHASLMAEILRRRTSLQVEEATEGARVEAGTVYIAPPDGHLLVTRDGSVSLSHADPVHFVRPSADLLFESARVVPRPCHRCGPLRHGQRRQHGGARIRAGGRHRHRPGSRPAEFAGMPQAAIETGGVDFVLPLEEIGPTLVALVERGACGEATVNR